RSFGGMPLVYSEEPSPLGTAGALRWALSKLSSSTVLVLNGDSYCDVDLSAFRAFHQGCTAAVSFVPTSVPGASWLRRGQAGQDGRVSQFEEKAAVFGSKWINAGIYLLERPLIEAIPAGRPLSLERDLFPGWVESKNCRGFRCAGRFLDIGTPESYAEAKLFF